VGQKSEELLSFPSAPGFEDYDIAPTADLRLALLAEQAQKISRESTPSTRIIFDSCSFAKLAATFYLV
jgi:hypothetical protein